MAIRPPTAKGRVGPIVPVHVPDHAGAVPLSPHSAAALAPHLAALCRGGDTLAVDGVVVRGVAPGGLTDRRGNFLNGANRRDAAGVGSDFVAVFRRGQRLLPNGTGSLRLLGASRHRRATRLL